MTLTCRKGVKWGCHASAHGDRLSCSHMHRSHQNPMLMAVLACLSQMLMHEHGKKRHQLKGRHVDVPDGHVLMTGNIVRSDTHVHMCTSTFRVSKLCTCNRFKKVGNTGGASGSRKLIWAREGQTGQGRSYPKEGHLGTRVSLRNVTADIPGQQTDRHRATWDTLTPGGKPK